MDYKKEHLEKEYKGRINRVIDYIYRNLAGDLSIETLANIAAFSVYHFHRIFKKVTSETVNTFIRRTKIEKAASILIGNTVDTITEIAFDCGFSSSSCFAREFREFYGKSASIFRQEYYEKSRIRKTGSIKSKQENIDSKTQRTKGKVKDPPPDYIESINNNRRFDMKFNAEAKTLPELHVAYVRHTGPYNQIGDAIGRLMRWAGPRGLARFPETKLLAVYHNNPEITDKSRLKSDACLTVPEGTEVKGEIGTMTIPGGLFAVADVEIDNTQFGEAWDKLIGEWIPEHGYQGDNRLCYEMYLNDPKKHPEKKHIVRICEPVKPL